MTKTSLLLVTTILWTSCKKDYVCECPTGGTPMTYTIKDTKAKAAKKCEETITVNFGGCKLKE